VPPIHIIRTADVPDENYAAFHARLEERAAGGNDVATAALNALVARTVTKSSKQPFYAELDSWLAATDSETLGEHLMQVRRDLAVDLDLDGNHA
jgi:hypothetical protein